MNYDYSYLWLNLLNTIVMYMFFPVIYKIRKEDITEDKAKKIALINSIVICLVFIILKSVLNSNGEAGLSWLPAMTYYYINKWYLSKPNNVKSDCIVGICFTIACGIIGWFTLAIPMYLIAALISYSCFYYSNKSIRIISVILFYIVSFLFLIIINDYFLETETNLLITIFEIAIIIIVNTIVSKNKTKPLNKFIKNSYKCSECGGFVSADATKCPYCGAFFEDSEQEIIKENKNKLSDLSSIDNKYNDLTKLKKLLDKNIITQEEFEREKQKILK